MRTRGLLAALAVGVAVLALAAVALAVPPNKGIYLGQTGQGRDVGVKVNDKNRVKEFRIEYKAKCDTGATWTGGTVDKDRKKDRIKQPILGTFTDEGKHNQKTGAYTGHAEYELDGEFDTATSASGKFKVNVRITKNGNTIDHCKKTVQWDVS